MLVDSPIDKMARLKLKSSLPKLHYQIQYELRMLKLLVAIVKEKFKNINNILKFHQVTKVKINST